MLAIACGFIVPVMFVVGAIFAVLWVVSVRMGDAALRRAQQFEAYVGDAAHPVARSGPIEGAHPAVRLGALNGWGRTGSPG